MSVKYYTGTRWADVKAVTGVTRQEIIDRYLELYGRRVVPDTWVFNDFGEWAIKFYKDSNHNQRLDPEEKRAGIQPQFIHTTPDDEAATAWNAKEKDPANKIPIDLSYSHGCIHVRPEDRDVMNLLGAFGPGTPFTILTVGKGKK